jgi:hypothetical protein
MQGTCPDEAAARANVCAIAATWIGTPYHDHGEVKGAGCDCATLLKCVFVEAGLLAPFDIGYYSPQHFLHQSDEHYLGWLNKFGNEIGEAEAKPGDVVLYKAGLCFCHGALIMEPGWPAIVHAHFAARVTRRGSGLNPKLGLPVQDIKFFSLF